MPIPPFIPGDDVIAEDEAIIAERKVESVRDGKLFSLLRDCGLQLLFLFVLVVIAYSNRDRGSYKQNAAIKNVIPLEFNDAYTFDFTKVTLVYVKYMYFRKDWTMCSN